MHENRPRVTFQITNPAPRPVMQKGRTMSLLTESRTVFNGSPGTVTTLIKLIPKDEFSSGSAAHLAGGRALSMDELLSSEAQDLVIHNPYTGHDETYAIDLIRAHFAGLDLANAVLQIEIRFVPDNKVGGYPSEMVEELRSNGFPEDEIQRLLEWERSIRST